MALRKLAFLHFGLELDEQLAGGQPIQFSQRFACLSFDLSLGAAEAQQQILQVGDLARPRRERGTRGRRRSWRPGSLVPRRSGCRGGARFSRPRGVIRGVADAPTPLRPAAGQSAA